MPPKSLLARSWLWAPPIAYMALIFFFSSQPDPAPALTEAFWDKTLHFAGYAGLAFLFGRAFAGEPVAFPAALVYAFVASSAYGATDEWHQSFTPGRSPSVLDWVADTVGAGIGVVVYRMWVWMSGDANRASRRPRPPRR